MKCKKVFEFEIPLPLEYFTEELEWHNKEEVIDTFNEMDIYDVINFYSYWTQVNEWIELE